MDSRGLRLQRVFAWVKLYLGDNCALDTKERSKRLLEEAVELAQAEGVDYQDAHRLMHHVYSRPTGDPVQEVGGIGVTLLAYCAAKGIDPDIAEATEIDRIWSKDIEYFRKRHQAKTDAGVAMQALKPEHE